MAFPHVWSAAEDNQPTGSTPIGQGDDYIAATRQMVRERIGLEHNFDFTNDAEQGSHREGSARVWVSETEPEDPIPAVTAETVGQLKKGRFWFKPSTGEAFVYDLGRAAWKAINITGAQLIGLVTALSAKSTVAAADKILILDSSAGGAGKLITADKFATAAQGVKADNALPAASYTAADVLAKVKTVDGVGSGLDADTVDSLHASAFATAAQGAKADAALPAASYTAADVLAKVKTVDGAGSGLDADLLDGQQGSYYQPASSAITTGNIGSQSVSNADTVDGKHASAFATAAQGAKADAAQPAATAINTSNIGAQSVSNADTVDGKHASAFATAAQGEKADAAAPKSWFTSGVAGSWSSHSIPKASRWVPPAGLYIFSPDSYVSIEVYDGSYFHVVAPEGQGGMFLTNGSILGVLNESGSSKTVYYRKLL